MTSKEIKEIVKVTSPIIYSQEGNYGTVNKNDNNHGMSIGKCQWNAYWGRALPLLQTIVKANPTKAKEILTDALYKEISESKSSAWNKTVRAATDEEAKYLSLLLKSDEGIKAQDALSDKDIEGYIKNGIKVGLVSPAALAFYADVENQGGGATSKRIALAAAEELGGIEKVGLDAMYEFSIKDSVMKLYAKRRKRVYDKVKASNLRDLRDLGDSTENKKEEVKVEPVKPAVTPTVSNVSKLKIGDIVTFIGGGIYFSSTAKSAKKTLNTESICKVTAVNPKGTHPYHLISEDGNGVYAWVDESSIKELKKEFKVGDTVTFNKGKVYRSSNAKLAARTVNKVVRCKITQIYKGTHPYHLISDDKSTVYGWVDSISIY